MLSQYHQIKREHPDKILMFRLGDFYEMFYDDAVIAARELDIVLTSRPTGNDTRIPMAGVPYHAVDTYLSKLLEKGYRIALCDQVEDPRQAKGLVKRAVTRVVTPGTVIDSALLDEKRNNYIGCVVESEGSVGIALADASTGEFFAGEIHGKNSRETAIEEMSRYAPSECLIPRSHEGREFHFALARNVATITPWEEWAYDREVAYKSLCEHFKVNSLRGFDLEELRLGTKAAGALLTYLSKTQMTELRHITSIRRLHFGTGLIIDSSTRRNLELFKRASDGSTKGSLIWVLDATQTSMGSRLLKKWLLNPLTDPDRINERLDAVEALSCDPVMRGELRECLRQTYDIERIVGKLSYGTANARDLLCLATSLSLLPRIKQTVLKACAPLLVQLATSMPDTQQLAALILAAITDDPPATVTDGGIIRDGFHQEIDALRSASESGKDWIAQLEVSERERTQIRSLRVGYNKVFGYYIEVTKPNLHLVPPDYIRRQTLANAERFVTEKLKEYEEKVLGAESRLCELEYEVFCQLRAEVCSHIPKLQAVATAVAELDVLSTFAEVAVKYNYKRPEVDRSDVIEIRGGRHPVVERLLGEGGYVPNDTFMNSSDSRLLLITGPNMAGKSTYCRQVALITLMAQTGSFVPADAARIGVVDRIFTRVGAHDDLSMGQSTFMVEMTELSNILRNATDKSLIILDEIGRGTSTYDGLAIAWAVTEYILDSIGAKTLFATHYRELVSIEDTHEGVRNHSVAIEKRGDELIFLRKMVKGPADGSYGIDVARLAGLPHSVVDRAFGILEVLEHTDRGKPERRPRRYQMTQLTFLQVQEHPIIEELKSINVMNITPVEAINILYDLQQKARRN